MLHNNYHPNLQPRYGQNGIGNLEHDHIISYLNHNKRLNYGPASEIERVEREKKIQRKKVRQSIKHQMTANVSGTRFEIVKSILESVGYTLKDDEVFKNCYLIWTDSFISQERLTELKSYQRINHFMGMVEICRKDFLAKKFAKMQKLRPKDYNYFPKTWLFPQESNLLHKYTKETKKQQKKKYFILKPANGAMGMGIRLFSEDDIIKSNDPSIVQEYIDRPFLLDGYKNDFRIYVLVTCCDPLRAFIYREGLVRLSTEKYILNSDLKQDPIFMHLTNYSVNKKNSNYTKGIDEASGSKQSLSSLMSRFKEKFNINTDDLWRKITDIIVKTLILVQPHLIHNYRMCRTGQLQSFDSVSFEILGFDILLDETLCPWLLEVNRSPSFGMDEALDKKVKGSLLIDTLRLINIRPNNKQKSLDFQKQKANRRLTLAAFRARIDSQLDNEALKKRKEIEKRKQDLVDLLLRVQDNSGREYFENRHVGNFTRIFPPDDKSLYGHYAELLVDSFTLFNQLNNQNSPTDSNQIHQQMLQSFMQDQFREEDLMEQIKECEKSENQILERAKLPQNAELTTIIPRMDFYDTSSSDTDSSSDSDSVTVSTATNDENAGDYDLSGLPKKRTNSFMNNANKSNQLSRISTGKYSRPKSVSQQQQMSSSTFKPNKSEILPKSRNIISKKSISLSKIAANKSLKSKDISKSETPQNRNIQISRNEDRNEDKFYYNDNILIRKDAFIKSPIYEELLKILLTSLNSLTIRYPGQSVAETKLMLTKINSNWDQHKRSIATYWLVTLNSKKRDKVMQIVKNNVNSIMEDNFKYAADICATRLNRLILKVYNRLLWNRGHGLIQCYSNIKSWQLIFSNSGDSIKAMEIDICSRIVQLCLDCVLIVHQYSTVVTSSDNPKSKQFNDSPPMSDNLKMSKLIKSFSIKSGDNVATPSSS